MTKQTIYLTDCIKFMKQKPDNFYDLAIPDPPYGIGENGIKGRDRAKLAKTINYYPIDDSKPPTQEYFDELFRVSKYQIIWGCNYMNFTQKSTSSGRIFWDKVNGNSDQSDGEMAWTNLIPSIRQIEFMQHGFHVANSLKNGRVANGNRKNRKKRIHPNQKPVLLYAWLLQKFAKKGWSILDTHSGSGSLAVACQKLDFSIDACEIVKHYYNESNIRLNEAKGVVLKHENKEIFQQLLF